MKVFVDTNVIVSAFTARGLSADLFRYLLAEHDVMTGEVNVVELKRVLRDKFDAGRDQIIQVERQVREFEVIPKPDSVPAIRIRDADDLWVLASAIAGGADLLVTGDKDLLSVAGKVSLPVLTPREAWERLRTAGPGGK